MTRCDWGYENVLPKVQLSGVTNRNANFEALVKSHFPDHMIWVRAEQTHGNGVAIIDGGVLDHATNGIAHVPVVDALVSDDHRALLTIKTADCLPILIWHPSGVRAAIHAGRRSTDAYILRETLATIKDTYDVSDGFTIWFGPAICETCYQIDREMDLHYNLVAKNDAQLQQHVAKGGYSLFKSDICTACRNDEFFSYRKEGARSGRIWTFIG